MEDSTDKTIAFLRARLLAERSVSRTARQQALELAKRVTELEKQLKFVSLQRKKAEKAAADVLAILENHGKNDISEPIDSSSDEEEMPSDFMDDKHVETEGFSGSEVESSSVNGKSLSWKNRKVTSHFLDKKYMDASRRRRNSFTSTSSSPRRVGKSCRQIRHREHRSGADVSQNDDATNGHHENEGQTSSEGVQNSADVATEASLEETNMCNGHAGQNNGTEQEMERALEHQAQFIAQYEEEEKAQREWEDKYRENNGSTPENSYDHGTHSDVTEETEETKVPSPLPPGTMDKLTSESQRVDHGVINTNLSENPKPDPEPLPVHDVKKEPFDSQSQPPALHGTPTNLSQSQASSSRGKSYEPDLETEKVPDTLGYVLEALQQAKLSLKQNLDKFPLLENGPSPPNYRGGENFPVPFSSARLFRVPTDYEHEETTLRANSLTYDPRLNLPSYPTDDRQLISSPYRESFSRSTSSLDDRFRMVPTFPYQETMTEIPRLPPSALNPRLDIHPSARDPRLDTGMGPRVLDPRIGMSSFVDPQLGMGPSALDPRLGVGPSAHDPRLGVGPSKFDRSLGVGASALDPRLGVGPSTLDPRLGVGPSALDPRLGVGPNALDPRLGVGQTTIDSRMGVGQSAFDPRLDTGSPFIGDRRLNSSASLPLSSRYGTLQGGDIPLQTRSFNDHTRPNMYN